MRAADSRVKVVPGLEEVASAAAARAGCPLRLKLTPAEEAWAAKAKASRAERRPPPANLGALLDEAEEPFACGLRLALGCALAADFAPKSLPYRVVEQLGRWAAETEPPRRPPSHLKSVAFRVAVEQKSGAFVKLAARVFLDGAAPREALPLVRELLGSGDYRVACLSAIALSLQPLLDVEELLVPLLLQDRICLIDEYLASDPASAAPFVAYLDGLVECSPAGGPSKVQAFLSRRPVDDVKWDKLHHRPLGKLIARLCRKFAVPLDSCEHLGRRRAYGGIRFLVRQRYKDGAIGEGAWSDLVVDTIERNPELAVALVDMLSEHDPAEAAKWAHRFGLSDAPSEAPAPPSPRPGASGKAAAHRLAIDESLVEFVDDAESYAAYLRRGLPDAPSEAPAPPSPRPDDAESYAACLRRGLPDAPSEAPAPPSPRPDASGKAAAHRLAIDESLVEFVDDAESFAACLRRGLADATLVGVDSEWKPSFDAKQSCVSLVQIATATRVYVLDAIALNAADCLPLWAELAGNVFEDPNVLKIGFGLDNDARQMANSIPGLGPVELRGRLEVGRLWKAALEAGVVPPHSRIDPGEGLGSIVEQCFGERLDKDEQCSNWENRPLRPSQLRYAALDAHVLLEIHDLLRTLCERRGIDFEELRRKAAKRPKDGRKKRRNLRRIALQRSKDVD